MAPSPGPKPRRDIPLGHTIPAHQAFGWCSYCPDRTPAEELAAWQTREPIDDGTPTPPGEIERLRTQNERMRHELEVMYGGAFDSLKTSLVPAATDAVEITTPPWAAECLPLDALESAANGATMIDAWAEDPNGRNFLAHALAQLARDGWLRREPDPDQAFNVSDRPRVTPAPQPATSEDGA